MIAFTCSSLGCTPSFVTMHEKNNFLTEKAALRWLQFQMFHSEPGKDDPHVMEVIILIHRECDDIIQVDQAVGEV